MSECDKSATGVIAYVMIQQEPGLTIHVPFDDRGRRESESCPRSLGSHNIGNLLTEAPLLWLPAQELPGSLGLSAGIHAPARSLESSRGVDSFINRPGSKLGGTIFDEPLLVSFLADFQRQVAPGMLAIFGKNIAMRPPDLRIVPPGRIQRSFYKKPKDPAQVVHVDIVPLRKTLPNSRAILLFENKGSKLVHLASAAGNGAPPLAVDRGRANDGRLDRVRVLDAGVENDLVHVTVEGGGW